MYIFANGFASEIPLLFEEKHERETLLPLLYSLLSRIFRKEKLLYMHACLPGWLAARLVNCACLFRTCDVADNDEAHDDNRENKSNLKKVMS